MKTSKLTPVVATLIFACSIVGCGTTTKQTLGTAGGAVVGGVIGDAVTGGSTVGTLGGAAVGGVIGNRATRP